MYCADCCVLSVIADIFVVCRWLSAVCYSLFDAGWLLLVVRCELLVGRCLLYNVCCLLSVVCCLVVVAGCVLCVVRCVACGVLLNDGCMLRRLLPFGGVD